MNYTLIGIELLRLLIYLGLSYFMFGYVIRVTFDEKGPEMARALLSKDSSWIQQLKSVDKRLDKTANQKIAKDLMENSPLAPIIGMLTKETRDYLLLHPEVLPGVLQNYAGPIDIGLKMLPQLTKMFPELKNKLQAAAPGVKFDY